MGCNFITSSARHPQINGSVERANGVLKKSIRKWRRKTRDKDWADYLPIIVHQLKIIHHDTIGVAPYQYAFLTTSWKQKRLLHEIITNDTNENNKNDSIITNQDVDYEAKYEDNNVENFRYPQNDEEKQY